MDKQQDTLLKFPCEFPIKVMGLSDSGFEVMALEVIRRHAPDFDPQFMHTNTSSKGKYLATTFTVTAQSKGQLDSMYYELTACKDILMVL
ncbi:MAG: DUF493 domain-containing protein [Gammaproteobacteria bacterium]